MALGEATKTVPYVTDALKAYRFTVRWGAATDTDDAEGTVIATSADRPTDDAIRAALPRYTGDIHQVPPAYSAVKVDGERAYAIARAGDAVDLAPRPLWVESLTLDGRPDADHASSDHGLRQGRLCPRHRPRPRPRPGLPRPCGDAAPALDWSVRGG